MTHIYQWYNLHFDDSDMEDEDFENLENQIDSNATKQLNSQFQSILTTKRLTLTFLFLATVIAIVFFLKKILEAYFARTSEVINNI